MIERVVGMSWKVSTWSSNCTITVTVRLLVCFQIFQQVTIGWMMGWWDSPVHDEYTLQPQKFAERLRKRDAKCQPTVLLVLTLPPAMTFAQSEERSSVNYLCYAAPGRTKHWCFRKRRISSCKRIMRQRCIYPYMSICSFPTMPSPIWKLPVYK